MVEQRHGGRDRAPTRLSKSAGILLFRHAEEGPEVLLVIPAARFWVKKDLGAWSIPKGEIEDEGRTGLRAAERCGRSWGRRPRVERDSMIELGSVRQRGGKLVHAWAAEGEFDPAQLSSNTFTLEWPARSGTSREFPEVDRAEWFAPEEAKRRINPAQAEFIDRLLAMLAARP